MRRSRFKATEPVRLRRPKADAGVRLIVSPTLRQTWPRELPEAAMCVQDVDVQCVLQFTLIHAAGCALHRPPSRVIHHLELSKKDAKFDLLGSTPHERRASATRIANTPLSEKHSFTKRSYLGAYNVGPMTDEARQYCVRLAFHKARSRRSSSSVFEVTEPVRLRHPKRRPPLRKGRRVGALSTSPRPSRGALGEEPFSLSDRLVRLP